jgi:hypothetical protein
MHQSRRRSSARPRLRTTATTSTSWLNRWEAEQEAREAELASIEATAGQERQTEGSPSPKSMPR